MKEKSFGSRTRYPYGAQKEIYCMMRLFQVRSSIGSNFGALLIAFLLASCGGGGGGTLETYTVSVTVSNLISGTSIVLLNDGADSTTVSSEATVTFPTPIPSGDKYFVTVAKQPAGQTCSAISPNDTVGKTNVTVTLQCSLVYYQIEGSVSGLLPGDSVVLENNGVFYTRRIVQANGQFAFPRTAFIYQAYSVAVSTQPAAQDCTVTNASGTVFSANITNVTVQCVGAPVTISAQVTGLADVTGLSLQDNGGDTLTIPSSGIYPFKTQLLGGTTYSVSILTQPPGRTCAVINGSGTVNSNNPIVMVGCPWHVGYNPGGYAYYVDQLTGVLTAFPGGPFAVGAGQIAIAVSPGTQFLYGANMGANSGQNGTVSGFLIDPASGALSPMASGPLPVGLAPVSIAIDPHGRFLYVANSGSDTISAFTINPPTGTLTAAAGSPFAMANSPLAIAVDSTGSYVYAYFIVGGPPPTNPTVSINAGVSAFSIDATTGALTHIAGSPFIVAPPSVGGAVEPTAFAVDPNGNFLYVGFTYTVYPPNAPGSGVIVGESIDPATGALSPIAGGTAVGIGANSIVIDPAGKFMFTGSVQWDGGVFGYGINPSSGELSQVTMAWYPCGLSVCELEGNVVSIDPSDRFLYIDSNFSPYSITSATGALTGPNSNTGGAVQVFSSTP